MKAQRPMKKLFGLIVADEAEKGPLLISDSKSALYHAQEHAFSYCPSRVVPVRCENGQISWDPVDFSEEG